jgi:hypothetical protein
MEPHNFKKKPAKPTPIPAVLADVIIQQILSRTAV